MFSQLISQYPRPHRDLLFQCPYCKELVSLKKFATSDAGVALECPSCAVVFFYEAPTRTSSEEKPSQPIDKALSAREPVFQAKVETAAATQPADVVVGVVREESRAKGVDVPITPNQRATTQASAEVGVESRICPKCGALSPASASSCRNCGLLFANVGVTFRPKSRDSATDPLEKAAWILWEEVEKNWENSTHHEKFLQYGIANEMFEFVSSRYRETKERGGVYADVSQTQLIKVVELVQQQFAIKMQRDESSQQRVRSWKFLLTFFLLLFGLVAFYLIWRQMFVPSQVVVP